MTRGKTTRRREPWTEGELNQLGKVPDSVLAHQTGRTIKEIVANRKPWTQEDKALLGKFPDTEVARRTGHSVHSVLSTRCRLGIPYQNPERRPWTTEEDALLGTLSDREISQRLGRTFAAVRARRIDFGLCDPSARTSRRIVPPTSAPPGSDPSRRRD